MHFGHADRKKAPAAAHIHDLHSFCDVGSEYFQGLVKKFTHRIVKLMGQPPGTDMITSGGSVGSTALLDFSFSCDTSPLIHKGYNIPFFVPSCLRS
jgi:hypothetical protein